MYIHVHIQKSVCIYTYIENIQKRDGCLLNSPRTLGRKDSLNSALSYKRTDESYSYTTEKGDEVPISGVSIERTQHVSDTSLPLEKKKCGEDLRMVWITPREKKNKEKR